MKINIDEEMSAYQLRKVESSKPSMGAWLIVIVIGVFLGNMASWSAQRGIDYVLIQQAIKEASKQAAIQSQVTNARLQEQRQLSAAKAKQRNIELQKKQAGLRQASETCNFWRQQVARENTNANRRNREQSCNLVNQFR